MQQLRRFSFNFLTVYDCAVCTLYCCDIVQYACVSNCHTEKTASVSTTLIAKQSTKDVSGMLSLHARLQQEAEKIRRWKIQTEMELNQKVMSLYSTSSVCI